MKKYIFIFGIPLLFVSAFLIKTNVTSAYCIASLPYDTETGLLCPPDSKLTNDTAADVPQTRFKVTSPFVNQEWQYGTSHSVTWQDNTYSTLKTYDIIFNPAQIYCENFCRGDYRPSYTVAEGVTGSTYSWSVSNVYNGYYTVQVCQRGTQGYNICGVSAGYVQVTGGPDYPAASDEQNTVPNFPPDAPPTPPGSTPPPPPPAATSGGHCSYNQIYVTDSEDGAVVPDPNGGPAKNGVQGIIVGDKAKTVAPGASTTFFASLAAINGFFGQVNITATGLPYGAVPTFGSSPLVPGTQPQTIALVICTEKYVPTGSFPFQIHAGGVNIGYATLVVSSGGTVVGGGTSVSSITPVVQKKIKLLPDFLDSSTNGVIGENLSSGSAEHLTITPSGAGEKPLGIAVDAVYSREFKDASGGTCEDTDSACRYPAGPVQRLGNITGPRFFRLDDPLNPVIDSSKSWNLDTASNGIDYAGDYGPYLHLSTGPFFSSDGAYSTAVNNTRLTFLGTGTSHALLRSTDIGGTSGFNEVRGIVQSGPLSYLVHDNSVKNITDYVTSSGKVVLPSQPSKTPVLASDGKSVILGEHVAQLDSNSTLRVFSLSQSSALSQKNITGLNISIEAKVNGYVAPSGKKYVFITNVYSTNKTALYVYEINSSGATITPIVEGLGSDAGIAEHAVGITVGGQDMLLTFNTISDSDPQNVRVHAYLISDLKNSTLRDVWRGTERLYPQKSVVSFATSAASYVYMIGTPGGYGDYQGKRAYVWKFDNNSINGTASGTGTVGAPGGDAPVSGGTANCSISPGTFGCFEITPSLVKNGGAFTIKLKTAGQYVPTSAPLKLFISTAVGNGAYTDFKNFGDWYTVGDFITGRNYQLNCSAYSSYTPGQLVNLATLNPGGTYLHQKLYATYFSGSPSEATSSTAMHIKDCTTP